MGRHRHSAEHWLARAACWCVMWVMAVAWPYALVAGTAGIALGAVWDTLLLAGAVVLAVHTRRQRRLHR